ncbi:MAG TPA: biopolymer transporter ExbD [Rhodothermales bacterium]|nr:biopolymer transporter ExbD [Rhodothermales bacterium]
MADVDVQSPQGGKGKKKAATKRTSTKIDMTPMVDLGFLLITFFMLTTTLAKPQTMEITMPDKNENKDDKMKVKESRTLTVLLGDNDKVYYYRGIPDPNDPQIGITNFGKDGIRKTLLEKKREIGKVRDDDSGKLVDGIIVIIKAKDTAKYKNMVDILDEMNITNIGTYAIVDMSEGDLSLMEVADNGGKPLTETAGQTAQG